MAGDIYWASSPYMDMNTHKKALKEREIHLFFEITLSLLFSNINTDSRNH